MESVVSQTWSEPRERLEKVCRLLPGEIKPFSPHGNLNLFHPVDLYFQFLLASLVILLGYRVLVSIRNWSTWAQEVGGNFGWHRQTALVNLALPRH